VEVLQLVLLAALWSIATLLPVSGGGHMAVIGRAVEPALGPGYLQAAASAGIMLAIIARFGREIWRSLEALLRGLWVIVRGDHARKRLMIYPPFHRALTLVIAAFVGLGAAQLVATRTPMFDGRPDTLSWTLVAMGGVLWASRWPRPGRRFISIGAAILLGLLGGLGTIPGLSRVGLLLVVGMFVGLTHAEAVRYAFILLLPMIFVDCVSSGIYAASVFRGGPQATAIVAGIMVAALLGYAAIGWVQAKVRLGSLFHFGVYLWGIGMIVYIFRSLAG